MDVQPLMEDEDALFTQPQDNIQPYQFEPMSSIDNISRENEDSESDSDIDNVNDASDHLDDVGQSQADVRTDNLAWCDCDNCAVMDSECECLCCQEVGPVSEKMDDAGLTCITDHEGFIGNCLNRYVIEVSMYEFVERDKPIDDNEPINELYRYIAYRRFTRWIWQHLGKGRRKVILSCAVKKIRAAFPSESYAGFRYARP